MNSELLPVVLSGFADEVVQDKCLDRQLSTFCALGLTHFSIRFVRVDNQIQNVLDLDAAGLEFVKQKIADYDMNVSSLGSPIGKVKLLDVEDGTSNRFVPFADYLANDVHKACELACALGTRLVRGFSFYPPKGEADRDHVKLATERIAQITEVCASHQLIFGLEVEANLVGNTGQRLAEMYEQIQHPALALIFDGANLVTQGFDTAQVREQYDAMKAGMGWIHVKDYRDATRATTEVGGYVDEEALSHFVSADKGDSGYLDILGDVRESLPEFSNRLSRQGISALFLDLEPHMLGGGQFGGYSGPAGFGVAFRALTRMLDQIGLDYQLRDETHMHVHQ